ncbi:MAG: hypothetical protein JWM14_1190 [Chitinophagaceae bacterium]|nr:hypothetical protein [Chitinophagaceae bacterium]
MNFIDLFGEGENLTATQMSLRAIVIFISAIALLRISGRRSLGMKMPFDYVILFLLGALLSRGITGAAPFFSTLCAALTLVLLHRLCGWIGLYSNTFGQLVKGSSKIIYQDGQFIEDHMKQCAISKKDLLESIRLNSGLDSIDQIDKAYVERNGEISIIPKHQ